MLFHFELIVFTLLREFGRILLETSFNCLEGDGSELPQDVMFSSQGYRRLGKKTRNEHVATLFGKVCLWRFPYRIWERVTSEPCLFPLELQLGLVQGVTPALADLIGRRMAEAGATQNRVLEQLRNEHGVSIGVKRLRKLVAALTEGLSDYREACQVEALLDLKQVTLRRLLGLNSVGRLGARIPQNGLAVRVASNWVKSFSLAFAAWLQLRVTAGSKRPDFDFLFAQTLAAVRESSGRSTITLVLRPDAKTPVENRSSLTRGRRADGPSSQSDKAHELAC